MTGKISMQTMLALVTKAIQEDPRWDTDKHGQPESSPGDCEPWCLDVLEPNGDGSHCAVILTDDGRLVKHCFTYDSEAHAVTMAAGDSTQTERTEVYARLAEAHDEFVRATWSDKAREAALEARRAHEKHAEKASEHAAKHDTAEAHSDAAGAHYQAKHHAEMAGDKAAAAEHEKQIKHHEARYQEHRDHREMVHDAHAHLKTSPGGKPTAKEVRRHIEDTHGVELTEEQVKQHMPVEASAFPASTDMVYCRASGVTLTNGEWSMDKPARFQYMPGGVSTIQATYADKPIELTVQCDEQTACAVQASLNQWRTDYPKLKPFMCIEHREEEAAAWPEKFEWAADPEPGVYCSVMPGELGVRNVNGKVHRSFSPTFRTDAEYHKAKETNGRLSFPEGVRGSKSNPARVTGVNFSVGSLTNVPAFTNILPVRAKQADPLPVKQPTADNTNINEPMIKLKFIKARGSWTAGQVAEVPAADAVAAITAGDAEIFNPSAESVQASNTRLEQLQTAQKEQNGLLVDGAIVQARARGAIAPKDETVKAKATRWLDHGMPIADVVGLINDMPGSGAVRASLAGRLTQSNDAGLAFNRIDNVSASLQEVSDEYIRAREPMTKLVGQGKEGIQQALKISTETSAMLKTHFMPIFARGGDVLLRDVVRAAGTDVADPDSQVGTLATGLLLMRNLGFLKNKLGFLPYISTDLRNEPAMWNQTIRTRYITPPNILTYVPGVGYTSDAATIAAYNAANGAKQAAGTLTPSVPSSTDVDVKINKHYGVEITFPTSTLGSTMRNLFAEQQGAQFYSLAQQATQDFLTTLFGANWTGVKTQLSLGANFGLSAVGGSPGVVGIKNAMTLSKFPDTGRFALMHSIYHDQILNDSNLVTAKAITAVVNKDLSAMESGELPILYGIKVLESQLAASKAGVLVSPTDGATIGNVADTIGFAGDSASMLFVARVPQDYTTVFKDIPATAAIEIITEPDSGLSIMFVKYVNHGLGQVYARCALMYGFAQGDPRRGILLKP